MKKVLFILCYLVFVLVVSSCNSNDNISSITSCFFVDAGVDNSSTFAFSKNQNGIKELIDDAKNYEYHKSEGSSGIIIDDSSNAATFAAYTAVVSINKFDIYVLIDSIPNDVKSVKADVDNDIVINGIKCKSGESYDLEVIGTKLYFVLSVELSKNTVIKVSSITDEENNSYTMCNSVIGHKRANEIEIISTVDYITFDETYNTFTISDIENVEFKSISYNNQTYLEKEEKYSFDDCYSYNIKYVYKIKNVEIKCDRVYEKTNNCIYHIGSGSSTVLYESY